MIKYNVIISLIFLFGIKTFSQIRIEGEYCNYDKYADLSTCYNFINGIFSYESSGHISSTYYGEGTYQISKDSLLTLDFNKTKNRNKYRYKIISSSKNCKDSIQLKFIVKDSEGILPYPYNGNIEIKKKVYLNLNKDGIVYLKKENQDSIKIKLRNLGFNSVEIKLKSHRDYAIDVFLSDIPSGIPIKNKKIFYKIERINDSILILNENGIKSFWKNRNYNTVYKK
ncbi:hypothetical protein CW731_02910 [Polaribacter sp. ALD11]|uniref:hypothetical protein n=1 Tax=Polaribacter sp. ALD11 TaxID=2058137 RepID=UPI000C30A566|nr:hypothetical protein [Polaribacter sp. ALD11]AUC84312.1 hypothetical protein CW731_02910 [Polaribacter sp. ALD11]